MTFVYLDRYNNIRSEIFPVTEGNESITVHVFVHI